ncbi:hypothetical protein LY622_17720 [Halomonas sp. M5N1S17]|uniref:hypothetical protein n=1 Tax=Halomonas alkalisoli TaxID=2907158 RepID=UPI001F2C6693|nr:hypothetical protein [Halomonas alkalisoli]MCE9665269.1 hypothetical protein [Halomonas alkalisoli]
MSTYAVRQLIADEVVNFLLSSCIQAGAPITRHMVSVALGISFAEQAIDKHLHRQLGL